MICRRRRESRRSLGHSNLDLNFRRQQLISRINSDIQDQDAISGLATNLLSLINALSASNDSSLIEILQLIESSFASDADPVEAPVEVPTTRASATKRRSKVVAQPKRRVVKKTDRYSDQDASGLVVVNVNLTVTQFLTRFLTV